METKRLFDNDSYLVEFESKVISCEKHGDDYSLILEETAFFPEEGGQTCDKGVIEGIDVKHVSIKDNIITHTISSELKTGSIVKGKIDWNHRFDNMQCHSGEHIMSGLINSRFGYDNVGFHLSEKTETLDFNGVFTDEELLEIENEANRIVSENRKITVDFYTGEAAKNITYRSKKELPGIIRIVTIEGVDVCACCAPHVALTGEIGCIKIASAEHFKGGTRITLLCGKRALEDYREKQNCRDGISVLLSVKPADVYDSVVKLKKDYDSLKYANIELQSKLLEIKEQLLTGLNYKPGNNLENLDIFEAPGYLIIGDKYGTAQTMRAFVNNVIAKTDSVVAIFNTSQENNLSYIAGSSSGDCRVLGNLLKERLSGKGGGKPEMIQGSVPATLGEIIKLIKESNL